MYDAARPKVFDRNAELERVEQQLVLRELARVQRRCLRCAAIAAAAAAAAAALALALAFRPPSSAPRSARSAQRAVAEIRESIERAAAAERLLQRLRVQRRRLEHGVHTEDELMGVLPRGAEIAPKARRHVLRQRRRTKVPHPLQRELASKHLLCEGRGGERSADPPSGAALAARCQMLRPRHDLDFEHLPRVAAPERAVKLEVVDRAAQKAVLLRDSAPLAVVLPRAREAHDVARVAVPPARLLLRVAVANFERGAREARQHERPAAALRRTAPRRSSDRATPRHSANAALRSEEEKRLEQLPRVPPLDTDFHELVLSAVTASRVQRKQRVDAAQAAAPQYVAVLDARGCESGAARLE